MQDSQSDGLWLLFHVIINVKRLALEMPLLREEVEGTQH